MSEQDEPQLHNLFVVVLPSPDPDDPSAALVEGPFNDCQLANQYLENVQEFHSKAFVASVTEPSFPW